MTTSGEAAGYPWSGEAVRRFLVALTGADVKGQEAALMRLLRLRWPIRWRQLWAGDPVREFLADPKAGERLKAMLAVPDKVEVERPKDEWDRLREMQTVENSGPAATVTLDTVCRVVEVTMGAGWWYAPDRWDTLDGFAPYGEVWQAWRTLQQVRALERLNIVRAIGITKGGPEAVGRYESDVKEALGG